MKFELLKVLDKIRDLYQLPRNKARFDKYLYLLQGANKDEILLPIAGFNPMGKELAQNKLAALLALEAEYLAETTLHQINSQPNNSQDRILQVAINLVDDVEGSWSTFCTTDYKSKFEFNGLLKRNFCTPVFWTSESVTKEIIVQRIKEYVYRTIYWIEKGRPETLGDCFEQEVYVTLKSSDDILPPRVPSFEFIKHYYEQHMDSTDYNLNLNFFYGDEATQALNYPAYGVLKNGGFEYAKYIARERKEIMS